MRAAAGVGALGRIVLLDEVTASKIAAGEVVERPASVVKELVENSIDAGARRIDVAVEAGGRRLIRVTDDGGGMESDDAVLAFSRHATSKIRRAEDIADVRTLGFRGEALASIAAVARVEMRTRPAGASAGTIVRIEAGNLVSAREGPSAPGTTVEVRDLFFNVPARLKFLKNDRVEAARITEVVYGLSIAHPRVSIGLWVDGSVAARTEGTGDALDAIASLYGRDLAVQMVRVDARPWGGEVAIGGYAGRPSASRGSRSVQYLFVNSRLVRSPAIRAAVEEAYSGLVPGRRFPVFFLYIAVPGKRIDVNVHPQKAEVRIADEAEVKRAVYAAVREAVAPPASAGAAAAGPASRVTATPAVEVGEGGADRVAAQALPLVGREGAAPYVPGPFGDLRVLGQALDSYIVAEGRHGLYIFDQHAAHERVWYERLLGHRGAPAVQPLADPEVILMAPADYEATMEALESLRPMGFDVEPFGNNTVLLRGIPAGFEAAQARDALISVVSSWSAAPRGSSRAEAAARALAACHSAVRAGARLSIVEACQLLRDLGATRDPFRCPHGRPTVMELRAEEMEKRFGRR